MSETNTKSGALPLHGSQAAAPEELALVLAPGSLELMLPGGVPDAAAVRLVAAKARLGTAKAALKAKRGIQTLLHEPRFSYYDGGHDAEAAKANAEAEAAAYYRMGEMFGYEGIVLHGGDRPAPKPTPKPASKSRRPRQRRVDVSLRRRRDRRSPAQKAKDLKKAWEALEKHDQRFGDEEAHAGKRPCRFHVGCW